jgi:hypothetical protein
MPEVKPLRALHYDLNRVGGLQPVVAPPYDVIDAAQRAELAAQSPYNVVRIDLPEANGDPYEAAAEILAACGRAAGSWHACAWRNMGRAASAPTSGPTPGRGRTVSG